VTNPGYPYGTPATHSEFSWDNTGGDIVNKVGVTPYPDGYGWDGTATGTKVGEVDHALETYELVFSETDWQGERGNGIGTLPATVTIKQPDPIPTSTDMNSRLFNPKALVIYQDNTQEPFDENISQINRSSFSLGDPEKIKDGTLFTTSAMDGPAPTGTFVRAIYNSRDNTINYYYHDSETLRWIISKEPYVPTGNTGRLYHIISSKRDRGGRYVYKWIPFTRRRLI
jgi:hypothetical protein